MKYIAGLFFIMISVSAFSYSDFDRMRCNGKLVDINSSLDMVKSICGEPFFEKEDKNDFRTFNYVTYEAPGESSRYYLLFRNGVLERCKLKGYNSGDSIWINPENL